jgi:hypothetical protein
MEKVLQKMFEKGRGDCLRACVASLLELEIDAVPHFILHGDYCFTVFKKFLEALGYEFSYIRVLSMGKYLPDRLPSRRDLVKGAVIVVVPSLNMKGLLHCVLVNSRGRVIHDPTLAKSMVGQNVFEKKTVLGWYKIRNVNI